MQDKRNGHDSAKEHDNFYHYSDGVYNCQKQNCNVTKFRYEDGTLRLRNPNIENMKNDELYHLALSSGPNNDLFQMFNDVKFVCMGGTVSRMQNFAYYIMKELNHEEPTGSLPDITGKGHRFSMYKVGPVLCVSHGMGVPSIGILLHEMIKLMYHAKVKDPIFFRLGTCGGIGLDPGTVVVSNGAVDELGNPYYEQPVCGKKIKRPAILDKRLANELIDMSCPEDSFQVVTGTTMCANDFYEGQGRTDGAFCDHTEEEKMAYLKQLQHRGVKNIEMEATVFAAHTHYAGIKGALVNVTLVNRLNGDQITTPAQEMVEWYNRPQVLVARYIKQCLESGTR